MTRGGLFHKTLTAVSGWNAVPNAVLFLSLKHSVLRAVGNPRCSPRLFCASSPICQRSVLSTNWIVVLPCALGCGEMQGRCLCFRLYVCIHHEYFWCCRQVRPVRMSVLHSSHVSLGTLISEPNNRHVRGSLFVFNPKYSYWLLLSHFSRTWVQLNKVWYCVL